MKKSPNEIIGSLNTNQFFMGWSKQMVPKEVSDANFKGTPEQEPVKQMNFKNECKDLDSYCHRWKKLAGDFKL
jgi:hypothetical protein